MLYITSMMKVQTLPGEAWTCSPGSWRPECSVSVGLPYLGWCTREIKYRGSFSVAGGETQVESASTSA